MSGAIGRMRGGGVLLEVLLSLALFVGAASFTLGAISNVLGALDRSRRQAVAVDLARAKMAELEAGLVTIAELRQGAPIDRVGSIESYAGDQTYTNDEQERWVIEIDTEPTEFIGLTLVELTVSEDRDDPYGDDGAAVISFTLRQLMSLGDEETEEYELDELMRGLPTEGGTRP